jgi:hypothetical protein
MKKIKFFIRGQSPLLTHNPAGSMTAGTKGPSRNNVPIPEEEAEKATYRDESGNLVFPSVAFRNALLKAASGYKIGKKAARALLGHIQMDGEYVKLLDPETGEQLTEYKIDTRRAVVQKNGIMRSRPRFERWGCIVTFKVNEEILPNAQDFILKILSEAGTTVGVGDFRLEKGGWFGLFDVETVND